MNGTINVCPTIDSVSANPPVGNAIALVSSAHDPDAAPAALSLQLDDQLRHAQQRHRAEPDAHLHGARHRVADAHRLRRRRGLQRPASPCWSTARPTRRSASRPGSRSAPTTRPSPASSRRTPSARRSPSTASTSPMTVRVLPGREPLRPTQHRHDAGHGDDVRQHEAVDLHEHRPASSYIPAGAHAATVAGKNLPLPKPVVNRVVDPRRHRLPHLDRKRLPGLRRSDDLAVLGHLLGGRRDAARPRRFTSATTSTATTPARRATRPARNALGLRLRRLDGRPLHAGGAAARGRAVGHGPRQPRDLQPRRPGLVPVPRPEPLRRDGRQDLQRPGERQRRQLQRSLGRLLRRHAVRRVRLGERRRRRAFNPPSVQQPYTAELAAAAALGDPEPVQHLGGSPPDPRLHGGQPADASATRACSRS